MLTLLQQYGPMILEGFLTTCLLALLGSFIATALAFGIGLIRSGVMAQNHPVLRRLTIGWIELFRNTPLLCQVLFFYYCFHFNGFYAVLAGLATYTSAYMAEILRSGFQTVPQEELRAARLLGFSRFQTVMRILLPRALESVISPLGNQYVNLIKNTAIGYFVAVNDLTFTFEILTSQTYQFVPFFLVSLLGYTVLCGLVTQAVVKVERYLLRRNEPAEAARTSAAGMERTLAWT